MPDESKRNAEEGKAEASTTRGESDRARSRDKPISIIGIGASAGGLDPLRKLIGTVPADMGVAFCVVQHFDPKHESQLVSLLARCTEMAVTTAEDGTRIETNHVYVIPPDKILTIQKNSIHVGGKIPNARRHNPIDQLFSSIASARGEDAIAIVLSGTGSDGTAGCRAIRRDGGLVMVQDPQSADFPGMPQSVIDNGMGDTVLPPEELARTLSSFRQSMRWRWDGEEAPKIPDRNLQRIFKETVASAKCDFSAYKEKTLLRRIYRRMGLNQCHNSGEYIAFLKENPEEADALRKDMLIGVTGFFRDLETFDELREHVIEPLVEEKESDATIRVWVAGCATGEEAYSIAMLFIDALDRAKKHCMLQLFASDIEPGALERARNGMYSLESVEPLPEHFIQRFFVRSDGQMQVNKQLRDTIVFSAQNLVTDPPFSRLDLVSCRNVLIYLKPEAQKNVIALFAFALLAKGHLFLGKSDNIGGRDDLFQLVNKQGRIYRLRETARTGIANLPSSRIAGRRGMETDHAVADRTDTNMGHVNQQILLKHFTAAIVITDLQGRLFHCFGDTARYLRFPTGDADLDFFRLCREQFAFKLRPAYHQLIESEDVVRLPETTIPSESGPIPVNVTLYLVRPPRWQERLVAVVFEPASVPAVNESTAARMTGDEMFQAIERELRDTKEELNAAYEEFESSNEDLKAANEEVMSINEELQSSNEELETSKEELQSMNEELTTVNAQLNDNVDELTDTNNDLANLFNATQIATVFLDRELKIKRFTPSATELFHLIPEDIGRPIEQISQKLQGPPLVDDARKVIGDLSNIDREVQTGTGWLHVRAFPYRTLDNRIDGVVLSFHDVTPFKLAEEFVSVTIHVLEQPIVALDSDHKIVDGNAAFFDLAGSSRDDVLDTCLFKLNGKGWNNPRLHKLLDDELPKKNFINDYLIEAELATHGRVSLSIAARRVPQSKSGRYESILFFSVVNEPKPEK